MKFIFETATEQLFFTDVKNNQFFVCLRGALWQKVSSVYASQIADSDGTPEADYDDTWENDAPIARIIPTVTKIEF